MKILILSIFESNRSAAHRIMLQNASLLCDLGNDVTLVFPQKINLSQEMVCPNVKIKFAPSPLFPRFSKGGFGMMDSFYKSWLVLTGRYDIVSLFAAHRPAALLPALMSKFCHTAIIDEWWEWFGKEGISSLRKGIIGRIIGSYDSLLELPSKRLCDGVIAISNELKKRIPWHKNVIVLHGASEARKLTAYGIAEARRISGLSGGEFIVGMSNVSADDHEDNLPFFLAFQRLASEHQGLRLLMTGDEAYVSQKVSQYFKKETLLFCGWPEFERYNYLMSSCDLFVLPYPNIPRNAGRWPNKVGDYLSLNRPIVTNPTGDFKHLFQDYKLGWLCNNTAEAYVSLFKRLLVNRSEFNSDCFDSLKVAYDILSFEHRIKQMNIFFESLLKRRSKKD